MPYNAPDILRSVFLGRPLLRQALAGKSHAFCPSGLNERKSLLSLVGRSAGGDFRPTKHSRRLLSAENQR